MSLGKKLGLIALIISILFVISGIIVITQAPEIPDGLYDLMVKDQELAQEQLEEIENNASTLYHVADTISTILGLVGIIMAIVSIVMLIKKKEKGKKLAVFSIIIIIVFYFVIIFNVGNMGKAFEAGINAGMEMQQ